MATKSSKRLLTSIRKRDWSRNSESANAKYIRGKLETLGYKVPGYMKKGEIKLEQIEHYVNLINNKLEKEIEKETLAKMSKAEKKRYKIEKALKEETKKLRDIVIDRGFNGDINNIVNDARQLANMLKEYSKYRNKLPSNDSNINLENLNHWIDKGYGSPEKALEIIHSSHLAENGKGFRGMIEEIEDISSDKHLEDYLDRLSVSDKYRKQSFKQFNKMNLGQKIYFNSRIWAEFKLRYNKDEYANETSLGQRKYLERVFSESTNEVNNEIKEMKKGKKRK